MGNSIKCEKCEKELPKSDNYVTVYNEAISLCKVRKYNNGQYYSTIKYVEVPDKILPAYDHYEEPVVLTTELVDMPDIYICSNCVVIMEREKVEHDRRMVQKKQELEKLERERRRMIEKMQKLEKLEHERQRMIEKKQKLKEMMKSVFSERVKQKVLLNELDYADVKFAEVKSINSEETLAEVRKGECKIKKLQLQEERKLTEVGGRCSPREYAKWRNSTQHVSHCSQFRNLNQVQSKALALQSDIAENDFGVNFGSVEVVSRQDGSTQHEEALQHILEIASESSSQWLLRLQSQQFFTFCQTLELNEVQTGVLLDALSHLGAFLNEKECAKLSRALISLSENPDEQKSILCSYKNSVLALFFRGLIYCCFNHGFYSGKCVTQCLQRYLHSCEEVSEFQYDKHLLHMIATDVDASLRYVFTTVDRAMIEQHPIEMDDLKRQVHRIQSYNVPLYEYDETKLDNLQLTKHERGWDVIKEAFLQQNPDCVELYQELEQYLHALNIEELPEEGLRDGINATKIALNKTKLEIDDVVLIMHTLSRAVHKKMRYLPRKTQMLSVCLLLLSHKLGINRLLEVLTGEGKSCIIAMFAAALGMQGKRVDIITSSPVLARRDCKNWQKFFEEFNLTVAHNTETLDLLKLSQEDSDKRRVNCYQSDVVYGTVSSFSADVLREEFEMRPVRSNRGFSAAIVDEVDMLMLDEGVQFTYLSHQAALLRHINPVLAMVWGSVAQYTPLSTSDGTVLFTGVPKGFHYIIYEGVKNSEYQLEHPRVILESLIRNILNLTQRDALERLLEAQDAESEKSVLREFSTEDITTFINELNTAFPFQIVTYTLSKQHLLEIVNVKQDLEEREKMTADVTVDILLAGEGIASPLYRQSELSQGIERMMSTQCDLPSQPDNEDDQQVLQSDKTETFLRGVPYHLCDFVSKYFNSIELLKLLFKLGFSKAQSNVSLNSQEKKAADKAMESLTASEVLDFLQYLKEHIPCGFPTLYIIDDKGLLVEKSGFEGEVSGLTQEILVMDKGIVYPLYEETSAEMPQALDRSDQQAEPSPQHHRDEILHTKDGKSFKPGLANSFHHVISQCIDTIELLCLLFKINNHTQEKLVRILTEAPSMQETRSSNDLLPLIQFIEKYLKCRVVVYTHNEQTEVIHQCTRHSTDNSTYPEVPILLMDGGMLCTLHQKEIVEVPDSLKEFVANQLPTYIDSAFTALLMRENREYLIKNGKQVIPVDYLNSGIVEVNKKWGGGLQQMLEMKHHLQISPMSIVTNFMSHIEFFQRYVPQRALYGLSGTVGGSTDADILQKLYQLQICKIPTFRRSLRYEKAAVFVQGDRSEWLEQIQSVLNDAVESKSYAPEGRAVLVLCEDIRTAKEILSAMKDKLHKEPKLYDGEDSNVSIEEAAINCGDVIIATNLAGRGTDISVTDEVNDNGGLLCLLTFLPRNRRVELQAFGRTARCGNTGSVQYVLLASELPCEYTDDLDISVLRKVREIEESQRLEQMLTTDIEEVNVREKLFHCHCEFLKSIPTDRNDKQVIIDTINENWGQWLQMKQLEVGIIPKVNLMKELLDVQDKWRPPPDLSPEHLPDSNFHHLIKFGNELVRADREDGGSGKKENAKKAIRYYSKAIDVEPKYAMIAHYNRACCLLCAEEGNDLITKSITDLGKARELLKIFTEEVTIMLQCGMASRHKQRHDSQRNYLLEQMEVRMQVLLYFSRKIDEVVKQLEYFKKENKEVVAIPVSILDLIPEADTETNEELYGLHQLGLEFAFTVKEKPKFCWEALAVFALGLLQIAAGVCLTVFTSGALSSFGMGLISEGVSDCIEGVVGMVTGQCDLKSWMISKACSVGVTITCAGVSKFISKGTKAVKGLSKGGKRVIKDMRGMSRVAKDSWGKVLKTNFKNALKLVGKEMAVQGVMLALSEVENKVLESIFEKVGDLIAMNLQQLLEESFLSSSGLGLVVDCKFVEHLDIVRDRMDPVIRDEAMQYFSYEADEVLVSFIQRNGTAFDAIASRIRSLLPHHLEGKAAAVFMLAEGTSALMSLKAAVSNVKELSSDFVSKLKEKCYEDGSINPKCLTQDDSRYSLDCVKRLKIELAQQSACKLSGAITSVLHEKLTWIVNRGLSLTVNRIAATRLNKSLNVEGTRELIRAGQKANYIRSMSISTTKSKHQNVNNHEVASHGERILDPTCAGTLTELRVAVEAYDCNVIIEDKNGKRTCSISSSNEGEKPKITLLYIPQDKDHPLGHYEVKVNGEVISVSSENNSCMFESFAHGLNEARKRDQAVEHAISGAEVRRKVSNEIMGCPEKWHEHYKRKCELERMKQGQHFLLKGGCPRKNLRTELKPRTYQVLRVNDVESVIKFAQENGLVISTRFEYDKTPDGSVKKVKRSYFEVSGEDILYVENGAKLLELQVHATNASYSDNQGRCLYTEPSPNQIHFTRENRDKSGSAPVSFHGVPSEAGANAGILLGNSFSASENYNKQERGVSEKIKAFVGNKPFQCKVTVYFEDLIPKDINKWVEGRNRQFDNPDKHITADKALDRFRAVQEKAERQSGRPVTLQRVEYMSWTVTNSEGNRERFALGRDTEYLVHPSLYSKPPREFEATQYSPNKDLEGASISKSGIAGV